MPASRPGGRSARVQAAVFAATAELLREPDWSRITMARIAERAGVNNTTVYRRWGSLESLVGAALDTIVSERSPLPDTGTLAGDIRAHAKTLVDDLTGENRRFVLRALIIAGNGTEGGGSTEERNRTEKGNRTGTGSGGREGASGQRALVERTDTVRTMLERAAARGEPSVDALGYFDAVVGPLYGYALMLPGLVRTRAPVLVEEFLAGLGLTDTARHDPPDGTA
ncbi:TetR/AcrR family transcriptional regulator [Streptomyces sp. NPDC091215]|uniref:TetR/AcrR family transcriptional regulator n=1 Tax=Streptomyces sp. NPDC091215 TaxID=3155192 RepID=UPI003420C119